MELTMQTLAEQLRSISKDLGFTPVDEQISYATNCFLTAWNSRFPKYPATLKVVASTGSAYIKFHEGLNPKSSAKKKFGQLRIADHCEKHHLGYRWNLVVGLDKEYSNVKIGKTHIQYFYSVSQIDEIISKMTSFIAEYQLITKKDIDFATKHR